ncbi:MAG: hypothetical protein JJ971_04655 [Balneolaceae bacterium]|nr:hypothetical protein [Balneolaceae bacterium]MBO6545666.1 hypothetical protein [Balneolaceae bacterium]MBO6647062.1 hypothetical protein [Balneolaceae bacterium]
MLVQKKIGYDLWANQQLLKAIKEVSHKDKLAEVTRLFAHLFKAQVIWYNRVKGIKEEVEIWGTYTVEECESLLNDSHTMLEGIASKINETCSYSNSKGASFENSVADIFEHVIIHGQHHRAQVSLILRKAGYNPPATDYIFYLRSL